MNRRIALGILLLIAATIAIWYAPRPETAAPRVQPDIRADRSVPPASVPGNAATPDVPPPDAAPSAAGISVPTSQAPPLPQPAVTPPSPIHAAEDGAPKRDLPGTVETDLEGVQFMIRDFRTAMRENPIGNNAEITRALLGQNLKQVKLPVPDGSQVNADGELIDRWGTPYFFHQVSRDKMEVRSAGPDRVMWTRDDRQL